MFIIASTQKNGIFISVMIYFLGGIWIQASDAPSKEVTPNIYLLRNLAGENYETQIQKFKIQIFEGNSLLSKYEAYKTSLKKNQYWLAQVLYYRNTSKSYEGFTYLLEGYTKNNWRKSPPNAQARGYYAIEAVKFLNEYVDKDLALLGLMEYSIKYDILTNTEKFLVFEYIATIIPTSEGKNPRSLKYPSISRATLLSYLSDFQETAKKETLTTEKTLYLQEKIKKLQPELDAIKNEIEKLHTTGASKFATSFVIETKNTTRGSISCGKTRTWKSLTRPLLRRTATHSRNHGFQMRGEKSWTGSRVFH